MPHSPQSSRRIAKLNIYPDNAVGSNENTYQLSEDQVQCTAPELLLSPTSTSVSTGMPPTPLDEAPSAEYGFPTFGDSSSLWTMVDVSEDQQFQNWLFYGRITLREQLTSTIHSLSPSFDIKLPRPLQPSRSTSTLTVPQEPYYLEDPFARGSAPYAANTSADYQNRNTTNNDLFDFSIYESSSVFRKYDGEERRSRLTSLGCKSNPRPPAASTPPRFRFIQLFTCGNKSPKASVYGCSCRQTKHEAQACGNADIFESHAPIRRTKRPQLRQLILPQRVAVTEALSKQYRPAPPRSLVLPAQLAKRALRQVMYYQGLEGESPSNDSGELRSGWNHGPVCAERRAQTDMLADFEYQSCARISVYDDQLFNDAFPAAQMEEGASQGAEEVGELRLSSDWEAELISEYFL